jgi:geranylgeranyl diphosphate synthase type II
MVGRKSKQVDLTEFDLGQYLALRRELVETSLSRYLPLSEPEQLWQSMRYSVLSGGKRFRAILCLAAAEAVSASNSCQSLSNLSDSLLNDKVLPCCCAIEMVHAMSLIHDDLPALDNDDFRRGKPTNHKVFGEAVAVLAGDALLMLANEVLINETHTSVPRGVLLSIVSQLAHAIGPAGMVGGQIYDLALTGSKAEPAMLAKMHQGKTGALIRFSIWSGATLAGADSDTVRYLNQYGDALGLAFQIADDLLDVTGDIKTLGKTPGKDHAERKSTWVTIFGKEEARTKLAELEASGLAFLDKTSLSDNSLAPLKQLLQYAIYRLN